MLICGCSIFSCGVVLISISNMNLHKHICQTILWDASLFKHDGMIKGCCKQQVNSDTNTILKSLVIKKNVENELSTLWDDCGETCSNWAVLTQKKENLDETVSLSAAVSLVHLCKCFKAFACSVAFCFPALFQRLWFYPGIWFQKILHPTKRGRNFTEWGSVLTWYLY